jgi:hypothetical protein
MKRIENINMIGVRYNRLVVSSLKFRENNTTFVMANCDCGKEIKVGFAKLKNGHTKGCGCVSIGKRTHYKSKHPLYRVWDAIRYRCNNKNASNYMRYGGRGIYICDEWNNDFKKFYDWAVYNNWNNKMQVNRIDNNRGYSPENCNLVNPKENAMNRRSNRYVYIDGLKMVLQEAIDSGFINKSKFYKNKNYMQSFLETIGNVSA